MRNLIGFLKFIFGTFLNYMIFIILHSLGLLSVFNEDLCPILSNKQVSLCIGLILMILLIWSKISTSISGLHIAIKKYESTIYIGMFIFGVIVIEKCKNQIKLIGIYFIELMILYLIIEYETARVFRYKYASSMDIMSNHTEKPIVGREFLLKKQEVALNQLIKVLDNRTSVESFNVALIGAWGTGKTSVTDTLVSELQERRKKEKRYFILKINTQTFNGTGDIVEYVKNYFYCLFKFYGLVGLEGKSNIVFLSALAEMLKKTETTAPLAKVIGNTTVAYFSDIENERQLFSERVRKLLKRSDRKNVVFVIDDADRTDIQKHVLQLLGEFSSINGLISIISLCKDVGGLQSKCGEIDCNCDTVNAECDSIDKYVHLRVKIEDMNHIEYENSVKKQIMYQNRNINKPQNVYISCKGSDQDLSIFSINNDCNTQMIVKRNCLSSGNYNLLTELFLYDLEDHTNSFGNYLENVFMEYFYRSKELYPYVIKMLTSNPEEKETEVWQVQAAWTNLFQDDVFDWIFKLSNNAFQCFDSICNLFEAVNVISKAEYLIQKEILRLEDAYDYYMRMRFPDIGGTWENRKESPIIYSELNMLCLVVLNENEREWVNNLILSRKYDETLDFLVDKIRLVSNLFFCSLALSNFGEYMRKTMNNYRFFKMQLREAEIKEINYLDYLIKEWSLSFKTNDQIANLENEFPFLKDLSLNVPSLEAFINTILYSKYVTHYGERNIEGRLWVYHGDKNNFIIISKKDGEIIKSEVIDICGRENTAVTYQDWKAINNHSYEVWTTFTE